MADGDRHEFDTEAPTAEQSSRHSVDPLVGCTINDVYEIRERLDAGGMGVVYLAWDRGLHRYVALKVIRPHVLNVGNASDAFGEAARQAKIEHPAFVGVLHASTFRHPDGDGRAFFVMEYVKGGAPIISHAMSNGLSREDRLRLFVQLCEAIEHLHDHEGLIHFDLKNANVLVDDHGAVRVIDLGVARTLRDQSAELPGGTISCMSPEHVRGRVADLDHRCDIWSLGVILYLLLSDGRPPFSAVGNAADSAEGLRHAICESEPDALEAPPELQRVVMRALAKSPSDRYDRVADMREDVLDVLGEPRRSAGAGHSGRPLPMVAKLMAASLIAVMAVLIAIPLTPLLVVQWTSIQSNFGRWLLSPAALTAEAPAQQVAVIEFGESTDAQSLGASAGLDGVRNDVIVSHRRLHGELCRRLARSGAQAVVFDIVFRSPTEYDESFAAGIRALRDAGIGVVIAAPQWQTDSETGRPIMSDIVWSEGVGWGCYAMQDVDGQLVVPLVVSRSGEVMPSLPIAGFAAARHRTRVVEFELDEAAVAVLVREEGASSDAQPHETIELTSIRPFDPTIPRIGRSMGYREGDLIGSYVAATMELEAFEHAAFAYEDIFTAGEGQLQRWFSDRIVFVGNSTTAAGDIHTLGQDTWPGVYLQAGATESLLRLHRARAPSATTMYAGSGVSAGVAALMAMSLATSRTHGRRSGLNVAMRGVAVWLLVAGLGAGVLIAASVLTQRGAALYWSPFLPAVAVAVGACGGALCCSIIDKQRAGSNSHMMEINEP